MSSFLQARRALDGVCIAGSYLVVEFKDEKQKLQKGRGPGGPPPAYPPPRRSRSSSRSPPPQGSPPFSKPPLGMSRAGSSLPTAGRGPARWDAPSPPSRITSMMSSELPPPLPQQRSNPPKPTPGAAPSAPAQMPNSGRSRQANMFWTGVLAKSRQPQCEVACIDGPALAPVSWAGAEPLEWPAALDVMNRTDVRWVCGHLFSSLPQESKAVRRIVAAGAAPEQSAKLAAFATYLLQKERAGVVALDPARGAPPRTMYLIPPTEETCAKLDVVYPPADEPCMLALVVPAGAGT